MNLTEKQFSVTRAASIKQMLISSRSYQYQFTFSSAFDLVGNDWIGNDADKGYNKSPSVGVKNAGTETAGDEGWRQGDNMAIFSYGLDQDKRAYIGTNAVCVFGFHPKAPGHDAISSFIEARLADPFDAPKSKN